MNTELKIKLKTYASFTAGTTLIATNVDAQIVHTNINHYIGLNESYYIDLDRNSVNEFELFNAYSNITYTSSYGSFMYKNNIMGIFNSDNYSKVIGTSGWVNAIPLGNGISPSANFDGITYPNYGFLYQFQWYMTSGVSTSWAASSSFGGGINKYIGVQFDISGQTHYGWVRLNIESSINTSTYAYTSKFHVVDMAYESTPNTPINAGAMFLAPPPAINTTAIVNGGNIDFTFDASTGEEAISEYRLFVVKEGTTFGLTEAEANSNYVTVNPDGSPNYAHTFTTGTVDSDGNTVLRNAPTLDANGELLSANQTYSIYILNMGKAPYTYRNSLSTPSNSFTITTVGLKENTKHVSGFYSNGKLNITVDNTLVGADLKLYNTLGQVILSEKLNTLSNSFNLNQSEGMYIITIQKDDTIISKKILVK